MSTQSQMVFSAVSRRGSQMHVAANSGGRTAFTLVELLVVITIIGMLAALLMPAINRARENGRQTTCMNNQRQIGMAVQQYVTSKGQFPGYRSLMPLQVAGAQPQSAITSWQVTLLPNLGRNDLYEAIQSIGQTPAINTPANTPIKYWESSICPSDTSGAGRSDPWTSYVANTGRLDQPRGATPPPDTKYQGIFHDHIQPRSVVNSHLKVTNTDIKDGQATTLLISENVDALLYSDKVLPVIAGTPKQITDTLPSHYGTIDNSKNATERGAGFVWWDMADPNQPAPSPAPVNSRHGEFDLSVLQWPNNPYDASDPMNHAARPSSSHPNVVIMTFADGHTKAVDDSIEYKIYCLLMTPYGAKANTAVPQWQKNLPLDEGSF